MSENEVDRHVSITSPDGSVEFSVAVPSGRLCEFKVLGTPYFRPIGDAQPRWASGMFCYPANRTPRGVAKVGGIPVALPINEGDRQNHLHGGPWLDGLFAEVDSTASSALLAGKIESGPASEFPWDVEIVQRFEAFTEGVIHAVTVTNTGSMPAPDMVACHPWWSLGGARVDEMRVSAKAQGIVATDSNLNLEAIHRCGPETPPPFNLWPTEEEPLGPLIGSRTFDTCLTWFDRDENGVWTVAVSEPNEGLRGAVLGGSRVRAAMFVTPDFMVGSEDEELARTTFAIEPQTGLVNTLSLEQTGPYPGESTTLVWGWAGQRIGSDAALADADSGLRKLSLRIAETEMQLGLRGTKRGKLLRLRRPLQLLAASSVGFPIIVT